MNRGCGDFGKFCAPGTLCRSSPPAALPVVVPSFCPEPPEDAERERGADLTSDRVNEGRIEDTVNLDTAGCAVRQNGRDDTRR